MQVAGIASIIRGWSPRDCTRAYKDGQPGIGAQGGLEDSTDSSETLYG